MCTKKHGVNLSALESLQDFQRSLLTKKRKIFAMPFHGECWFSINDEKPERYVITAEKGIMSCDEFGVIYLKNRVKSIAETDTGVVFQGKGPFKSLFIGFDNHNDKTHFMTVIENVLSSDIDDSTNSSGSSDSGLIP